MIQKVTPGGIKQSKQLIDDGASDQASTHGGGGDRGDRTTINNNIIININNSHNPHFPEKRKSPSMQSDRGVISSRIKETGNV